MLQVLALMITAAPLFDGDGLLGITLEGPLERVVDSAGDRSREFAFDLLHEGRRQPVEVRARGNSRLRVCDFPPLRLNFPESASGLFAGQDKLKLVSHCRDSEDAEKDLVEEYAIYRMFGVLSDSSLRVRLLRVRYVDGDPDGDERYAFVLEAEDALADRLGGRLFDRDGVALSELDREQAALVYVFHYFIGNTDWSLVTAERDTVCCHNGILIEREAAKTLLVPYDFDLSGFVNASYAKPDPSLRINSVLVRRYRGYCIDEDALRLAVERIVERRGALYAVIDALPLLSEKDRERRKRYLSRFYKAAADPARLVRQFDRRCLG